MNFWNLLIFGVFSEFLRRYNLTDLAKQPLKLKTNEPSTTHLYGFDIDPVVQIHEILITG